MEVAICEGVESKWHYVGDFKYETLPRKGEQVVADNQVYEVKEVKHFCLTEIDEDESSVVLLCREINK